MAYKVRLKVFEGPLDLLLYLINKEEIDIYDIPIAEITEQYLEYLEFMKLLDLNIAGEFIAMAATLMHIKSKLLLPPEEVETELEELDPREELVKKLVEYKKFKEAADNLKGMEVSAQEFFPRLSREGARIVALEGPQKPYFEASLFDLIRAFSSALKDVPKEVFQEVIADEFSVEGKIHDLLQLLKKSPRILVATLFEKARGKIEIIAIFLAFLELIRLKEILVIQRKLFGEIEIVRNERYIKSGV